MRKTRFTEEQIINILKGVEAGQRVRAMNYLLRIASREKCAVPSW